MGNRLASTRLVRGSVLAATLGACAALWTPTAHAAPVACIQETQAGGGMWGQVYVGAACVPLVSVPVDHLCVSPTSSSTTWPSVSTGVCVPGPPF